MAEDYVPICTQGAVYCTGQSVACAPSREWRQRRQRATVAIQKQTSGSSTGTGAHGLAPASELSGSVQPVLKPVL
eukprot:4452614-Pyramimonas_sp.AAC.1